MTLSQDNASGYGIEYVRATPPLPEQEPVKLHKAVISAWSLREVYFDEDGEPSMHRSPPATPVQEPVAFYHPHKGFYWAKPTHISAPTAVDVPPVPLYATPPAAQPEQQPVAWAVQACSKMWRGEYAEIDAKAEAKRIGGTCVAYALYTAPAQRPWQSLTDDDWEKVANRKNTVLDTFEQGATWAAYKLEKRNT